MIDVQISKIHLSCSESHLDKYTTVVFFKLFGVSFSHILNYIHLILIFFRDTFLECQCPLFFNPGITKLMVVIPVVEP